MENERQRDIQKVMSANLALLPLADGEPLSPKELEAQIENIDIVKEKKERLKELFKYYKNIQLEISEAEKALEPFYNKIFAKRFPCSSPEIGNQAYRMFLDQMRLGLELADNVTLVNKMISKELKESIINTGGQ